MAIFLSCLYIFAACFAFGIVFNIDPKKLICCALGSTLGWFVYQILNGIFINDIPQYFLAAVTISIYAEIMARVHCAPVSVFLAISLISLVPGGGIYETMKCFIDERTNLGVQTGLYTIEIAGAVAMGVITVSSTVRIITRKGMLARKK